MPPRKPYLYKSRPISTWQCPKKHLEKRHPELAEVTANIESLFTAGHQVGTIAQQPNGTSNSVEIPFNRKMSLMIRETTEFIEQRIDFPIFEATLQSTAYWCG